jgi:hypothetical protein
MKANSTVDKFISRLKQKRFTDKRTGKNTRYEINDAVLAAFAIFFMQSPSFLAGQRHLKQSKGHSNAETIFQMERIPTDTHIRNLVDPVAPQELSDEFRTLVLELHRQGHLKEWQVLGGRLAFSLDGVYYFSSEKLSCPNCQVQSLNNGSTLYKHSAITPVIVAPGQKEVWPYVPEFIVPQDGHEKQDCELNAAKRWVRQEQTYLKNYRAILLGDDLYSKQPLCQLIVASECDFIFVCHPDSHPTLYDYIGGIEQLNRLPTFSHRHWNGRHGEIWTYRYLNQVPLRQGEDALKVNWFDVTITHQDSGEILYRNEWVTNLTINKMLLPELVACGRARWKSENENNNVLKNHGYHINHNFGHGEQHLASTLLTLNLLAFLLHTISQLVDASYRQIRAALGARRTFFNDIRALMRYLTFPDWHALLTFMFAQLELEPD